MISAVFSFSLLYIGCLTTVLSYTDIILVLLGKVKVREGGGEVKLTVTPCAPEKKLSKSPAFLGLNHNLILFPENNSKKQA